MTEKFIEAIKTALRKSDEIHFWQIISQEKFDYNLYVSKSFQPENYKFGKSKQYEINIWTKVASENKDEKIGSATFSLSENMSQDEIQKKITESVFLAKKVLNPYYEPLKKYTGYKSVTTLDRKFKKDNPKKIFSKINSLFEKIQKVSKQLTDVRISSCEILTSRFEIKIYTSLNGEFEKHKSKIYLEVIFTASAETDGKKIEMEHLAYLDECSFSRIEVKNFILENANIARLLCTAKKPNDFKGPVVLKDEAVFSFFTPHLNENPVVIHCSSKLKHMGISKYEQAKNICDGEIKGEKVTIVSNPFIKYSTRSGSFDQDTIPLRKLILVNESKFNDMFTSKQYADYLKIEPTGNIANIEVSHGKVKYKYFYDTVDEAYEIISFSSFTPDFLSGDFSAEIRAGIIVRGKERIPFKGGTFVGNCFKMFENMKLSKDTITSGNYKGPKAIMIVDAHVTGN